jgi:hypothetical protein
VRRVIRRRVIAFAASLSLSLGLTGVAAGPAEAHDGSDGLFKQGSDYFIHSYDGTWFKICDAEDDGHAVWAGYYINNASNPGYWTARVLYLGDPDGVDCTTWDVSPYVLTNIRVVEDNPDSSTNYYGPWHGWPVAGT